MKKMMAILLISTVCVLLKADIVLPGKSKADARNTMRESDAIIQEEDNKLFFARQVKDGIEKYIYLFEDGVITAVMLSAECSSEKQLNSVLSATKGKYEWEKVSDNEWRRSVGTLEYGVKIEKLTINLTIISNKEKVK